MHIRRKQAPADRDHVQEEAFEKSSVSLALEVGLIVIPLTVLGACFSHISLKACEVSWGGFSSQPYQHSCIKCVYLVLKDLEQC